jgi:hypothetical protein
MVKDEKRNGRYETNEEASCGRAFDLELISAEENQRIARSACAGGGHYRGEAEYMIYLADDAANKEAQSHGNGRRMDVHLCSLMSDGMGIHPKAMPSHPQNPEKAVRSLWNQQELALKFLLNPKPFALFREAGTRTKINTKRRDPPRRYRHP